MADIFVRHSLSSTVSVRFNITLNKSVLKGEEGDHKWLLEIGTTYPDANGNYITPKFIHLITLDKLDAIIEEVVGDMCLLIDWGTLESDSHAPYIYSYVPTKTNDVSINTKVKATIKESLPSSGMDLSNLKITLNNGTTTFDITNDVVIKGDPYEYSFEWSPEIRVNSTYGD